MEDQGETVHVIEDWYDGPRAGFADYHGAPHFFRSLYLDLEDYKDYNPGEDRFELTPVSQQAVEWAVEDHHLWQKWNEAYRTGTLKEDKDDTRILPQDKPHHQELRHLIEQHLSRQSEQSFIVRGKFDSTVQWLEPV